MRAVFVEYTYRFMFLLYEIRFSAAAAISFGERCKIFQRPLQDLSAPAENSRSTLTPPPKPVAKPDLARYITQRNVARLQSELGTVDNPTGMSGRFAFMIDESEAAVYVLQFHQNHRSGTIIASTRNEAFAMSVHYHEHSA